MGKWAGGGVGRRGGVRSSGGSEGRGRGGDYGVGGSIIDIKKILKKNVKIIKKAWAPKPKSEMYGVSDIWN